MAINWYPGHMVKAKREIAENIKLVDIVLMLLDARAPFSCRNPDLERMISRKKIILILNKMDLASPSSTQQYLQSLQQEGYPAAAMDSSSGKGAKEMLQLIKSVYQQQAEEMLSKGRRVRSPRVMVVGVPNIGKSTFLNCLVGKKVAQTGAKPGVTRGKQWVRVREDIEFMDTPGLMWPKVGEEEQGYKLALLNIVGENAYEEYDVALYLLKTLQEKTPQIFSARYKVEDVQLDAEALLAEIARKRGYLNKGGMPDIDKTCHLLLQDYRRGNLGRVSLD
ncbi:MAG: Ras superfamily GTP-binding protein YlqF [Firmicutes bacterium]|nr:Ras superfamily GTP-binding protein YlqF [Bacillota bacterium]